MEHCVWCFDDMRAADCKNPAKSPEGIFATLRGSGLPLPLFYIFLIVPLVTTDGVQVHMGSIPNLPEAEENGCRQNRNGDRNAGNTQNPDIVTGCKDSCCGVSKTVFFFIRIAS
jgi:hypothetical protein